jgi:methyltransferase (TIGR00027 family)
MPTHTGEVPPEDDLWDRMSLFMGMRSRFFDEYFAEAWTAGTRQAVVLAAGLDCRAYRLDWPSDTTVFEIDQPRVLEFKDRVLAQQGARPNCERHVVAVDLRDDWAQALVHKGFDPEQPTAWLAEGLLPYLPGEAVARLLDSIHSLSAPGSTVAVEYVHDAQAMLGDPNVRTVVRDSGFDLATLFASGPQRDPADYLSTLGWVAGGVSSRDLAERYGRTLDDEVFSLFADNGRYLTARLR